MMYCLNIDNQRSGAGYNMREFTEPTSSLRCLWTVRRFLVHDTLFQSSEPAQFVGQKSSKKVVKGAFVPRKVPPEGDTLDDRVKGQLCRRMANPVAAHGAQRVSRGHCPLSVRFSRGSGPVFPEQLFWGSTSPLLQATSDCLASSHGVMLSGFCPRLFKGRPSKGHPFSVDFSCIDQESRFLFSL